MHQHSLLWSPDKKNKTTPNNNISVSPYSCWIHIMDFVLIWTWNSPLSVPGKLGWKCYEDQIKPADLLNNFLKFLQSSVSGVNPSKTAVTPHLKTTSTLRPPCLKNQTFSLPHCWTYSMFQLHNMATTLLRPLFIRPNVGLIEVLLQNTTDPRYHRCNTVQQKRIHMYVKISKLCYKNP